MKSQINIPKPASAQSFIAGAPDAKPAQKDDAPDTHQKQISLKLPLDLLDKIDTAARALNLSRASWIKMQATRALGKD